MFTRIWAGVRRIWQRPNPPTPVIRTVAPQPEPSPFSPRGTTTHGQRVVTVNGVFVPEGSGGVTSVLTEEGHVFERKEEALLLTGDGTLTRRLEGFSQCALCARDAQLALQAGQLSQSQALVASLCQTKTLRPSGVSGAPLCPRHARTLLTPDGPLVVSTDEAAALDKRTRRQRYVAAILGLFVERAS